MQTSKQKIKPPFCLDGIQAAHKGKMLNYRAEKDSHLEQYFYNLQMRQMISKMKQNRQSRQSLNQSQSKSFDKTILQHRISKTNISPKQFSPIHKSSSKQLTKSPLQNMPRSLSKEHFVSFLDSLISTVQNVQQLVITYFPQDQVDGTIQKQQLELVKINEATKQLSQQLRTQSLNQKKCDNNKTLNKFVKLPQLDKKDCKNSQTERHQSTQYRKTPGTKQRKSTIEKQQEIKKSSENNGFEPSESIQDDSTKKSIQENTENQESNLQENKKNQDVAITQLPQVLVTQLPNFKKQQQLNNNKNNKEIQQNITNQHKNQNFQHKQADYTRNRSVSMREQTQKSNPRSNYRYDLKNQNSLQTQRINSQKSKSNLQRSISQSKNIVQRNQQNQNKSSQQKHKAIATKQPIQQKLKIPIEIVEEAVQNFSNESGLFATQTAEQDIIKMNNEQNGSDCFKIQEEDEKKESISKFTESDDNDILKNKDHQVNNKEEVAIKVVESIEQESDNIVNPLEDEEDQQQDKFIQNSIPKQLQTLESRNDKKDIINNTYGSESFQQE